MPTSSNVPRGMTRSNRIALYTLYCMCTEQPGQWYTTDQIANKIRATIARDRRCSNIRFNTQQFDELVYFGVVLEQIQTDSNGVQLPVYQVNTNRYLVSRLCRALNEEFHNHGFSFELVPDQAPQRYYNTIQYSSDMDCESNDNNNALRGEDIESEFLNRNFTLGSHRPTQPELFECEFECESYTPAFNSYISQNRSENDVRQLTPLRQEDIYLRSNNYNYIRAPRNNRNLDNQYFRNNYNLNDQHYSLDITNIINTTNSDPTPVGSRIESFADYRVVQPTEPILLTDVERVMCLWDKLTLFALHLLASAHGRSNWFAVRHVKEQVLTEIRANWARVVTTSNTTTLINDSLNRLFSMGVLRKARRRVEGRRCSAYTITNSAPVRALCDALSTSLNEHHNFDNPNGQTINTAYVAVLRFYNWHPPRVSATVPVSVRRRNNATTLFWCKLTVWTLSKLNRLYALRWFGLDDIELIAAEVLRACTPTDTYDSATIREKITDSLNAFGTMGIVQNREQRYRLNYEVEEMSMLIYALESELYNCHNLTSNVERTIAAYEALIRRCNNGSTLPAEHSMSNLEREYQKKVARALRALEAD